MVLEAQGHSLLRHHLVCSVLSKKPLKITHIHDEEGGGGSGNPSARGIQPYEANLLKFITRITSGSRASTSQGNTVLQFTPGSIIGGTFTHVLPVPEDGEGEGSSSPLSASQAVRSLGYLLEVAVLLLPFAKYDSLIRLEGPTQGQWDVSVDSFRVVTLRWLRLFGIEAAVRVLRRSAGNGGAVELAVRSVRRLQSVQLGESRGLVRRVRGIAFSSRTASELPQRVATAAKGVLLTLLPDVYVVTDVGTGSGKAGYGVVLVADTTSSRCVISQETVALPGEAPEAVGERCAKLLLEEVMLGGAVDRHHQLLVLTLMAIASDEDTSSVRLGSQLTPSGVSGLLLMEQYFGVRFAVRSTAEGAQQQQQTGSGGSSGAETLLTCVGCGLLNVSKKSS